MTYYLLSGMLMIGILEWILTSRICETKFCSPGHALTVIPPGLLGHYWPRHKSSSHEQKPIIKHNLLHILMNTNWKGFVTIGFADMELKNIQCLKKHPTFGLL